MREIIALCLLAGPVWAQANCAPRDNVTSKLEASYGETIAGGGLQDSTRIFEVWVSDKGTWTILLTRTDGTSCIMASGTNRRKFAPKPLGEKG